MNHDHAYQDGEPRSFWRSRYAIGLLVMGAIASYFLLTEHRAHFLGALPLLLLLACPLMHVFMHHGHGGHGGGRTHQSGGEPESPNSATSAPIRTGERP